MPASTISDDRTANTRWPGDTSGAGWAARPTAASNAGTIRAPTKTRCGNCTRLAYLIRAIGCHHLPRNALDTAPEFTR